MTSLRFSGGHRRYNDLGAQENFRSRANSGDVENDDDRRIRKNLEKREPKVLR